MATEFNHARRELLVRATDAARYPHLDAADLDLLTGRTMNFTGLARGEHAELLRVPSPRLRELLTKVPRLSEKLLIACMERRRRNMDTGTIGMKVIGPGKCRDTTMVREFLFKNFIPFTWDDSANDPGKTTLNGLGNPRKSPSSKPPTTAC